MMTKTDFWEWIRDIMADYIDCDECMFHGKCKRVKAIYNHRIAKDICVDELKRNYEELKEAQDDD